MDGYDSFITFTNDYFHYGYIYPIKERTEALEKFKILKIKIVRSDRGGTTVGIPHIAKFLDLLQGSYRRMA